MKKCLMPLTLIALSLSLTSCGLLKLPANIIRHTGRMIGVADNNAHDLPIAPKVSKPIEKNGEQL